MAWEKFVQSDIYSFGSLNKGSPIFSISYFKKYSLIILNLSSSLTSRESEQLFLGLNELCKGSIEYPIKIDSDRIQINKKSPLLNDFFKILIRLEPMIKEIIPELFDIMEINFSSHAQLLNIWRFEELKTLPITEAAVIATKMQDSGDFDTIWNLYEYWHSQLFLGQHEKGQNKKGKEVDKKENVDHPQALYDLVSKISDKNPHYTKAQQVCLEMLLVKDESDEIESAEVKELHLTTEFTHSVQGGGDQELTDALFHQLCGKALGEDKQSDVRLNAATLIELASQIKKLTLENYQLRTRNNTNSRIPFFTLTEANDSQGENELENNNQSNLLI